MKINGKTPDDDGFEEEVRKEMQRCVDSLRHHNDVRAAGYIINMATAYLSLEDGDKPIDLEDLSEIAYIGIMAMDEARAKRRRKIAANN